VVLPIVRRVYPIAAIAWAALLPIATWLATRAHASTLTHLSALAVYIVGAAVCHQKPERSFHLWGAQLPVCARCTGIYLGAALAVMLARRREPAGVQPQRAALRTPAADPARVRAVMIACAIPTAATLLFEWTTGIMPANPIRFAAGLPIGAVVSWLVLRPLDVVSDRSPRLEGRVD